MNVFPLIISLAWMTDSLSSQRSSQPKNSSHLWSQCYDDLGCVDNTEEWFDPVLRPIREQPLPRHVVKTTFILFNKGEGPRHIVDVEPLSPIGKLIRATKFDDKKFLTIFLIHDFTSNGIAGWIKHAVKSLLSIEAGNVISVDWTGGAEPPYAIAVQNARLVALEVAALLRIFLNEFVGMSPARFYLIGQGVGAHIAGLEENQVFLTLSVHTGVIPTPQSPLRNLHLPGTALSGKPFRYVGQRINGVGRITGLDPVGLYFKGMPPSTRLDPEDAKFVDVINTDIESNHGQGSGDPYGHLNFFPNGGLTQAGCNLTSLYPNLNDISRDTLREGEPAPGCNHKRASKYFTATIDERNDKCVPIGYACGDYSAFERGECISECNEGSSCSRMGYFADIVANNRTASQTAKFFLDTSDSPPYCMFAYRIIIALEPGDESLESSLNTGNRTTGIFRASVFTDSDELMFRASLNSGMDKKPLNVNGNNVFLTYQKPRRIGSPDKMGLRFESKNNETIARVRHVEISHIPDHGNSVTRLCGNQRITLLNNRADAYFTTCDDTARYNNQGPAINSAIAFPLRRNPRQEKNPSFQTLDDTEYDESEPPEPAEDDYYTN